MVIVFQTEHKQTVATILEELFNIKPSMIGVSNLRYDIHNKELYLPLLDWLGKAFTLTLIHRPEINHK